jgi:hypothetical protein
MNVKFANNTSKWQIEYNSEFKGLKRYGNGLRKLPPGKWYQRVLEKMWFWAKEVELNPKDIENKLLLAKDQYGYITWHRAAEIGCIDSLEEIWSLAKEAEPDKYELLLV